MNLGLKVMGWSGGLRRNKSMVAPRSGDAISQWPARRFVVNPRGVWHFLPRRSGTASPNTAHEHPEGSSPNDVLSGLQQPHAAACAPPKAAPPWPVIPLSFDT